MKQREEKKRKARRKELVKYKQNMSDRKGKKSQAAVPEGKVRRRKKKETI